MVKAWDAGSCLACFSCGSKLDHSTSRIWDGPGASCDLSIYVFIYLFICLFTYTYLYFIHLLFFNHQRFQGSLETVQEELRQQLAAKPTVVFVQYSVGHHDDDEKQASPWVEKVQAGWGANHLVSHVDVTDSGMYDRI